MTMKLDQGSGGQWPGLDVALIPNETVEFNAVARAILLEDGIRP
jgi:hypothetical protein